MKPGLAAQVLIYDDMQYVDLMLENVLKHCDHVLFLVNKHPLNTKPGIVYNNEHIIKALKERQQEEPKIHIEWRDWTTEEETRNFGLQLALQLNCEFSLIVDTDEVYDSASLFRLKNVLQENEANNLGFHIMHTSWKTYWKKDDGPLCVITPPEGFTPVVLVRNKNASFTHLRHCMPVENGQFIKDQNRGRIRFPDGFLDLHHFSYARSDEFIRRKCEESGHSQNGDLMKGWFENVWMKWSVGMKNIHPINPVQYLEAVPVKVEELPMNSLRCFFSGI